MLADTCVRHQFDNAVGECRACQQRYCQACLVWTHGPKRPPMCIQCAIAAAGIRHSAAAPAAAVPKGLFGRRRGAGRGPATAPIAARPQVAMPAFTDEADHHVNGNGHGHSNGNGSGPAGRGEDNGANSTPPADEPVETIIPGLRVDL